MISQTVKIYRELISENGFFKMTVKGTSMEPLLKDGQQILIKRVIKYRLGDCYLFRYQNRIILHRLAGKLKNNNFLFIGDNSCKMEIIPEQEIIGCLQEQRNYKIQKIFAVCINYLFIYIYNKFPWFGRKLYSPRKDLIKSFLKEKE